MLFTNSKKYTLFPFNTSLVTGKIKYDTIDGYYVLVNNKIAKSKREAREFIKGNSISINGKKVTDENFIITKEIALYDKVVVIRRGKKKYYMGIYE